jgi:hypothetical protein
MDYTDCNDFLWPIDIFGLKYIGEDNSEEWKCNKYKCRRCNITFVWNRPNNPWDLLKFVQKLKEQVQLQLGIAEAGGYPVSTMQPMLDNLNAQMNSLSVAIDHIDGLYRDMTEKDHAMGKLVKEFKKFLMIEKIKLEE